VTGQATPTFSPKFHSDPSTFQIGYSQEGEPPTPFVVEDDLEWIFAPDGSIWRAITNFAGWKLDDPAEGEDIAQKTCMRVLRAIRHGKKLEPPEPTAGQNDRFRKYCIAIAKNLISDARAERYHRPVPGLPHDDYPSGEPDAPAFASPEAPDPSLSAVSETNTLDHKQDPSDLEAEAAPSGAYRCAVRTAWSDARGTNAYTLVIANQLLERLPERDRLLITLRIQGYRDDEIVDHLAATTGEVITENNLRQIRYRLMRKLSAIRDREPTLSSVRDRIGRPLDKR
jgi:DNA-directed RNA polymerase specialized sigma24 family protein